MVEFNDTSNLFQCGVNIKLNFEVALKSLGYTVGLYFVIKIFGPIIWEFLQENFFGKKNQRKNDLDAMIRSKEAMLRRGESKASGNAVTPGAGAGRRFKTKTEELYTLEFESLSKSGGDPEKKESAKKMIDLIGSGQWGEGPGFQDINKLVAGKIGREPELSVLSKHINSFLNREVALSLDRPELPSFEEVREALVVKILINILVEEAKNGDGPLIKKISTRHGVQTKSIINAVDYLVTSSAKGSVKDLIKKILTGTVPKVTQLSVVDIEKGSHILCMGADGKRFINSPTLMKMIEDQASLFESLTKLPPLKNKKDLNGALKLLGLGKNPEKEDVKKRYKKLAQLKHPDRMASKGLSPDMEKIASENFAVIQEAYHIILDHIDKE